MNTPLVTVVTVCLNVIQTGRKEMFLQCVESVRRQTYPRIEHLIIDGASTDGTIPLLQSLNLSFFSEKDTGIYDAMNKGIARGKGEYVLFLNTDDFFIPVQASKKASGPSRPIMRIIRMPIKRFFGMSKTTIKK